MTSPTLNLRLQSQLEGNSAEEQPRLSNTMEEQAQQRTNQPPFWLSKYALLIFALKCVSDSQDGFPLNFSSSEYSWTYGPTAVLIIVLSFWIRVDYYYKAAEPWRELQTRPVLGWRSLLLDYVSLFQLQSVYQSFRFRHYRVFATIFLFFLLKEIGLFKGYTEQEWFDGGSDKPVYAGVVTQRFKSRSSAVNLTSLTAPVDLFLPVVTCEDATLTMDSPTVRGTNYTWNSSTCSSGTKSSFICPDLRLNHDNTSMCGSQPWAYTLHRVNCSEVRLPKQISPDDSHSQDTLETVDLRYAITVAHHNISSMVKPRNVTESIKLNNHSAVLCKIGYKMVSVTATQDMLSRDVTLTPAADYGEGKLLRNLTSSSLSEMLMTDLDVASSALVYNKNVPRITVESTKTFHDWSASEALFQLKAIKLGDKFRPEVLSMPPILKKLSVEILEGLLNEVARQSLLVDKATNNTGDGLVSSPRLQTNNATVWVMVSGFLILSIVCLLLMIAPSTRCWISAMGGSIAGHVAVLANNPSLQRVLESSGELSEKSLTENIGDLKFAMTNASGDVRMSVTEKESLSQDRERRTNKASPWTPIAGSLSFTTATIAIPILAIGALELLQHQDDSDATKTLNLIRHGGANSSVAIWQDVVLPSTSLAFPDASMLDTVTQSSSYTYTVGALRPFINCTVVPTENLAMNPWVKTYTYALDGAQSGHTHEKTMWANFTAPAGCKGYDVNGKSYVSFNASVGIADREGKSYHDRWVGSYLDLNLTVSEHGADCPSVGIFFGNMGGNDTSAWKMTALTCTQGIEQIPTNIIFKGDPALGVIDEKHPPLLARKEAWEWVNSTSGSSALNYKLKHFLDDHLKLYPTHNITEPKSDCDSFFNHLIYGPKAAKKEELLGPMNVNNLIDAVNNGYSEYMRYLIDLNFRADEKTPHDELVSALASPSPAGEAVSPNTEITGSMRQLITRFAINPTSKTILQVLLAVIAVLSLTSYLLVKTRGTLPCDPCSIASTMAFLAGSQLCDRDSGIIPHGAEYMTDGQLKNAFDGWVFSLGWWQKGEASVESEERSDDARTSGDTDPQSETREGQRTLGRFGIDVGRASVSKF
ncbi:hypothetical protein FCIRC_1442 [Fusarium circinatum]|uniref:Uncharacterized protein n=1 Tax=Fusarium circinatum TaxID=48490 RepID=A0A8H5UL04_FUSCI|nr:hypothetical protein FCIRC_1442 [Fusarium circinatum]